MEFLRCPPRSHNILDAGCGEGYFLRGLIHAGYSEAGIDISGDALETARSRLASSVSLYQYRLDQAPWPFPDNSLDVVWSSQVIEHVFDVYQYLGEAGPVLRGGGHLILVTLVHGLIENPALAMFFFNGHFNSIDEGRIRFFARRTLALLAAGFGFREVVFLLVGGPPLAKSMFLAYGSMSEPV